MKNEKLDDIDWYSINIVALGHWALGDVMNSFSKKGFRLRKKARPMVRFPWDDHSWNHKLLLYCMTFAMANCHAFINILCIILSDVYIYIMYRSISKTVISYCFHLGTPHFAWHDYHNWPHRQVPSPVLQAALLDLLQGFRVAKRMSMGNTHGRFKT